MGQHHLWIDPPPSYIEHFHFEGRTYLVQPPGPALLLLPAVWLYGTPSQLTLSLILGAAAIAAVWLMVPRNRLWLTLFFGAGTIYAYGVSVADSWHLALTASVPFSLWALKETLEDGHPFTTGLCAGLAALMRYDLVLGWPFYAFLHRRRFCSFEFALLPAILILAWFNYARFGNPLITDLQIYARADPMTHGAGPFALRYLPANLNTLLFMPPYLDATFPYLHPHFGGQALIWTSPAFLGALRVRERSARVLCLWLMTLGVSLPSLLVYASGFVQFGARYYVQVYPFLFALLNLHAQEDGLDHFDKLLICASIFFTMFGIWHIRHYSWGW